MSADPAMDAAAHAIFDPIAADLLQRPDTDIGPLFGTQGVRVRGKVFAFLTHGSLVLKLPLERIDALEASGDAERMTMRGRALKEWAIVSPEHAARWRPLAEEARSFVDEITPRE